MLQPTATGKGIKAHCRYMAENSLKNSWRMGGRC